MRVLVCGGRGYKDSGKMRMALDALRKRYGVLTIIEGGAKGADMLALRWCLEQESVRLIHHPADWDKHGLAAGPKRNQEMIDEYHPELVLAFPGGVGTADMVRRAHEANIAVLLPEHVDKW